ncbi:MAG: substrate-binding domain-containing protein [Bacillota bacterium]|nr:substrate-binding domain-containing protein [Bacillota bacterium]
MKATIKDVAKEAGVSTGTVDRVINNKGNVAKKTEKKVLEAIEKLNYTKSPIAKALVSRRKHIKIGVVFPHLEHYFWQEVFKGIEEVREKLEPFGVEIIVETTKTYSIEEHIKAVDKLVKKEVNGIAMISYDDIRCRESIDKLVEKNIQVATFISDSPKSRRLIFNGEDSIKAGNIAGKLMGLYLKGKGNILIVGVHKILSCMQDRIEGFKNLIDNEFEDIQIIEIIENKELVNGEEDEYRTIIENIIKEVIEKKDGIDGIYVTNSFTGSVGNLLKKYNYEKEIVLVGHENTDEIRDLIRKNIVKATVYQNQKEEIIRSIEILYEKITDNKKVYANVQYIDLGILIKEKLAKNI